MAGNDSFTKVLLHMDGANGSTTFTDNNAGGSAHTWTANGNAQLSTSSPKFGTASGLFDGTGDWIDTPDSVDFTIGGGDFTAELWFNVNPSGNGSSRFLFGQSDSTPTITTRTLELAFTAANILTGRVYIGGVQKVINSTTTITTAGWHHAALVRTGNTLKLFLDGVQEGGDLTISGSVQDSANKFSVGRLGELAGQTWFGNIDEFRLSVGVARWTSNFTPPSLPYGIDFSQTVSVNCVTTASVLKAVSKTLSDACTSLVTLAVSAGRFVVLNPTLVTTATLSRSVGKTVSVVLVTTTSVQRAIAKLVSAVATSLVTVLKAIKATLSVGATTTTTVNKDMSKVLETILVTTTTLLSTLFTEWLNPRRKVNLSTFFRKR